MKQGWLTLYAYFLYPLLLLSLRLIARVNPKVRAGFAMRKSIIGAPPWLQFPKESRPIWIHCASYEFEYAKPVIRELKCREPQQKILVTYLSPSVRDAVSGYSGVDFSTPSPWDCAKVFDQFIAHHRPRALLIARTDTWPVMLSRARHAEIPSLLFSATFSAGAGRLKFFARPLSRRILSQLTAIFCVSEADRERVASLGLNTQIAVAGDTRFDQVLARLANPKPIKNLFADAPPSRLLVAGSTWEEDESQLIPTLAHFRGTLRAFIVPHEPTQSHIEKLAARLAAAGLRHSLYSEIQRWPEDVDVVVVDQIGILAELYALGEFAFVGGSFRKTAHSVMEPLAAGCLTFVGPLHSNNREAMEFRELSLASQGLPRSLHCVTTVETTQQWIETLSSALDCPKQAARERIRQEVVARSGRSQLVADWVLKNRLL